MYFLHVVIVSCLLQVNQDGLPFKDAVDGRVEIDKAAQGLDVPLAKCDTIVCAHGIGVLVECRGPDDPCVVEIEIGDVKHDSVFGAMKGNDAFSLQINDSIECSVCICTIK